MVCIFCSGETQVINSRHQKRPNHVWRRRKCLDCHQIFTTTEAAALDRSFSFVSADHKQPFIQELLFLSLYNSLRHRSTALSDANGLCQTVLGKLLPQVKDGSLQRQDIIKTSHEVLKRFDRAAAISYLAFHPTSEND